MPELRDPELGTPRDARIWHAIHQTGARIIGDRFLAASLISCLKASQGTGPMQKLALLDNSKRLGVSDKAWVKIALAGIDANAKWVDEMRSEEFHRVHVLSFLSLWAALEAGIENIVAAIVATVHSAATAASGKLKPGSVEMTAWPWSDDLCLEVAQKLEQQARRKVEDSGWNALGRIAMVFLWLGAPLDVAADDAACFNEASMVRNVLLHRYGRLGPRDLARAPHLAENAGDSVHLTQSRVSGYFKSVIAVQLAVQNAAAAAGWR